jgi:hypothetical protein
MAAGVLADSGFMRVKHKKARPRGAGLALCCLQVFSKLESIVRTVG